MELKIAALDGDSSSSVEVSEDIFQKEFNEALIHQVVVAHLAGARRGTRAHKSRSDVRGGGAKPWRQKGTGRARSGTIRSPIWRGGGKTFASTPVDHSQKVNRRMRRSALRSIFSELVRQDRLVIIDGLQMETPKTKELLTKLNSLGLDNALIVSAEYDEKIYLSSRNVHKIETRDVSKIDPVSLIAHEKVLMTVDALKKIEELLG